jgi:hypothetical protein
MRLPADFTTVYPSSKYFRIYAAHRFCFALSEQEQHGFLLGLQKPGKVPPFEYDIHPLSKINASYLQIDETADNRTPEYALSSRNGHFSIFIRI